GFGVQSILARPQPNAYSPVFGVPGLGFSITGVLTCASCSFFSVSGFTSAGPRRPSHAFQAAHVAKSRIDMCAIPAGPITGGASADGPHGLGVTLPSSPTRWPTGAAQ